MNTQEKFIIVYGDPGLKPVEIHCTIEEARRAVRVLNDHEIRNGRPPNYRLTYGGSDDSQGIDRGAAKIP